MAEIKLVKYSANRVVAALFRHYELTRILVKIQDDHSFFHERIIKRAVAEYREKEKASLGKKDFDLEWSRSLDYGFNIHNLEKSGVVNRTGDECIFTENFINLYKDVDTSEGSIFQRTTSEGELRKYLNDLDNVSVQLFKMASMSEQSKKDVIELAQASLRSFNQMIVSNTAILKTAIRNFGLEVTKGDSNNSLKDKEKNANILLKERVMPFNDFLIHSTTKSKRGATNLTEVLSNIQKILKRNGLIELELKYISIASFVKDTFKEISEEKTKLREIIQSSQERLKMMELSTSNLNKLMQEFDKNSDGGLRNKQLWNLPVIKEFDAIHIILKKSTQRRFTPYEDYLVDNLDFLSDELFNIEIEESLITDEQSIDINNEYIENQERAKKEVKIKLFETKIESFKHNLIHFYDQVVENESFDVYELMYEKLKILAKEDDNEITFNMVSSLASDFINGYKQKNKCLYKLKEIKVISHIHMKYPCLEFYKINKEVA